MARSASHTRHRRSNRWILPAVVVIIWLVMGFLGGPFAGKLASVQENNNAAFLPKTVESTLAQKEYTKFVGSESVPAILVFERNGGLTSGDRRAIAALTADVKKVKHVDAQGVVGPIPSKDGVAAQVVVPLATSEGDALQKAVSDIRDVLARAPAGLTAVVGGPGGILGDFIKAFGAIDGILLLVAGGVVLLILLVVYRSPILPFVVLFSAMLALALASVAIYFLASNNILDLNGQSQGILFILAVGAATDYSLLLVSRFREELRDTESKYDAMWKAWKAVLAPIIASGLTVILGLLCLLLSDLSSLKGLGPVGALGIAAAVFAALTLLPCGLALLGRAAFWPLMPHYGSPHTDTRGIWGRVSRLVGRRARVVWVVTFIALAACASLVSTLNEKPIPQTDVFLTKVDSVKAQDILDQHFQADRSSPAIMVVPVESLGQAVAVAGRQDGIAPRGVTVLPAGPPAPGQPPQPKVVDGEAIVFATLNQNAESAAATRTVENLRTRMDKVNPAIVVGGQTATNLDVRLTVDRDRMIVIPSILFVIFVVLALLLRSLLAPFLLLVANVLSFGATMGISAFLFNHVFGFPASDPSIVLIGFVFLVALGIDYSIFLMTRVREESIRQGTHPGILKGLSVTGGVITSAGVVLAATFAALSVLPILFLAQLAFIVAFGVLLDTVVVRSLLVPSLAYDMGPRVWWPSRLWHTPDHADHATAQLLHLGQADGVRGFEEDRADGGSVDSESEEPRA